MFKKIEELITWIESQKRLTPKVSLEKMMKLCEIYGNPQKGIAYIHVGGTNGKGSTVNFIKSILLDAGLNVGTYISPYIVKFNERISYNNQYISDEELLRIANYIVSKYDIIEEQQLAKPTFFELVTLIAFLYFQGLEKLDLVVMEVGLGGLLDATNVIIPLVSVITNVNFDHMNVLGNTLEEIALNKLGIVKKGVPLFTIQNDQLLQQFKEKTEALQSALHVVSFKDIVNIKISEEGTMFDYREWKNIKINLLGKYQTENASLAIEVVNYLVKADIFKISNENIYNGLHQTMWPGRLQVVNRNPLIILDGAHNIDGITRLAEFLEEIKGNRKLIIYFAVSADKLKEEMIHKIEPYADEIVFTHFNYKRSDDAKNLLEISHHHHKKIEDDLDKLVEKSYAQDQNTIVLFCGSLYFVSEILKKFER